VEATVVSPAGVPSTGGGVPSEFGFVLSSKKEVPDRCDVIELPMDFPPEVAPSLMARLGFAFSFPSAAFPSSLALLSKDAISKPSPI
jgi:hypothetical protein